MNLRTIASYLVPVLLGGVFLSACQPTRNFTTYFNLFYNMERIMDEVEEELLYIREQKLAEPVFVVPYDEVDRKGSTYYAHLERRSMNAEEMRANKIKLDSILIKGSKLMARNAKSDYLDDAIYYIGKTYFYEREWYQSQQKCEELIKGFPDSKWQPDAHLVLSMDMMQQGNISGAETMISRTIDIAWAFRRRDVLIDAFRLNADLQLSKGNVAGALKPYQQAMTVSSDGEDLARWQYEMALIHYRQADFKTALAEFDRVEEYSPDILTQFQTGIQRAASLRVLGDYEPAREQLDDLRSNTNYEPWWGMVELEKMNLASAQPGAATPSDSALALIDSVSPGRNYSSYAIYERGVRAFRAGDFDRARESFRQVRAANAPFQRRAQYLGSQLDRYFTETRKASSLIGGYTPMEFPDSSKSRVSDAYYNTARVFASLDLPDSLRRYYDLSYQWAPKGKTEAARVIYAWSVMARDAGRTAEADSLLEILVQEYELTDYAADARLRLGYTDYAKIDPAEDLYKSGMSFMRIGENQRALDQFQKVIAGYAESSYAPRAYYAIGLLYEEQFDNRDSALAYYGNVVSRYPQSEQAASLLPLIQAVNMKRMQQPHQNDGTSGVPDGAGGTGDGTGVNMDWMKENPPVDGSSTPPPDDLVPLNGQPNAPRVPNQVPPRQPRAVMKGQEGNPSGAIDFNPQSVGTAQVPPPQNGTPQNGVPATGTDGTGKDAAAPPAGDGTTPEVPKPKTPRRRS